MKILVLLTCLLAISLPCYTAPAATTTNLADAVEYRLSETVWPSYYRVQITPYLLATDANQFSFDGIVDITLYTNMSGIRTITLQNKGLTISRYNLTVQADSTPVAIINLTASDPLTDKFDVNLVNPLTQNVSYVLKLEYTGTLSDDMRGFYKSKYTNGKGEEVWICSTQFQTNNARRAFPCFDEPKFKARFKIDITHPSQFTAVSNTAVESLVPIPSINTTITIFKETPVMSSYLIAFIVSDFQARGAPGFTVMARPEAYSQTQYAYTIAPKLLDSLDRFTAFPYASHGLGKMDLAAIPDFSAGAMENWGLNTYRETALLYDPSVSTLLNQQRVATVIAHEYAHQWFGDLVTCEWWGYTWLNEGFGRYFQYFAAHDVEPTWELDKQFVVEQLQVVMNMDSLAGTTPMSDPTAATPADLSRMFNSISYNKGATIMRMVKHMITEEKFKLGLQEYLRNNKFQTAVPQNLFDAYSNQYGSDLSSLLRDWTEQVGFPVVQIELASDGKSFTAKQKRFMLRDDAGDGSLLYQIPFTYTTDVERNFENTLPKTILPKNNVVQNFTLSTQVKWVIGNIQEVGYYRVNYDTTTWRNIIKSLESENFGQIHVLNRAQIVDDVLNFGRTGLIGYDLVIDVLNYLRSESNYLPWYSAFQGYNYLATRLGTANEKYFKVYILSLLNNAYKTVGFNFNSTENRLVTYNRINLLNWACKYGHEECIERAKSAFLAFRIQNTPVEVNIRSAVYCTAIRHGNSTDFEFLWGKFKQENVATEQVLILSALGCTTDKAQMHSYLDRILSNDVRLQDRQSAFQSTYTSFAENVDIVWEYVQSKYRSMITSFGGQSTVASIISGIASRFTTETQRTSLKNFIDANKDQFTSSESTLNSALDSVDYNLKWTSTTMKPFVEHLQSLTDGAPSISISTLLVLVTSYIVAFMLN